MNEIGRSTRSSASGLQPVLNAIAKTAARLCDANDAVIFRVDGEQLRLVAKYGSLPATRAVDEPFPISRGTPAGRAVAERRTIHVRDLSSAAGRGFPESRARVIGVRTILSTPLLLGASPVGVIAIRRLKVRPFSPKQIALLKTFADQAAIAIENARLAGELQARNRDLTEALKRETATGEVLKLMSRSMFELQPVLDTLIETATKLCGADKGFIFRRMADGYGLAADYNAPPKFREWRASSLIRPGDGTVAGRVILEEQAVQLLDAQADQQWQSAHAEGQGMADVRTILGVPLRREGVVLGVITMWRSEVRPFTRKEIELVETFADQAVIAIENVRLFQELQARNRDLTEALEQQTATSEILGVISSSPTDVQPVFRAIMASAVRLCDGLFGAVFRYDGELLHFVAHHNFPPQALELFQRRFPMPPSREHVSSLAVLDRTVVHVRDFESDPDVGSLSREIARTIGYRSLLVVPMLREGTAIGAIAVARVAAPFSDKQIALLQTFADQAVIAIENVRLFQELQARNRDLTEALEQQTATSEVLKVISRSTFDLEPVLETLLENATKLCGAKRGYLYRLDGEVYRMAVEFGSSPEIRDFLRHNPIRPGRGTVAGRVALERRAIQVQDVLADPEYDRTIQRLGGFRTLMGAPLLREGVPIGIITIWREEVQPFTEKQIDLLTTFADQAVIAIENVRLFQELQARNRDLTEALEQQTATAEILRAISGSPTDVQPVFDIIAERAVTLCGADVSVVSRLDGELIQLAALHVTAPEGAEAARRAFPMRLSDETVTSRTVRHRAVVHIPDVLADPYYQAKDTALAMRNRSALGVPMLREGEIIGVIFVARPTPGYFGDRQVELLKTFADQAVIAIENVRLFQELQARTGELARSVEELKALGEVSRAVSSTLDLETVLNTIVARAIELSGANGGLIHEYDEAMQEFHLRGSHQLEQELVELVRTAPIRLGEGATGKAAALRAPVQVSDVLDEREYDVARVRAIFERLGYRSLLVVPLLFEQRVIGALGVWRRAPGSFAPEVVHLVQTFATQSVLAIQNARLFREIEEKSRQLEVASRHKSEFLANMSHELRTPLNAIIGFSEVLQERMFGELNEKQAEYLEDIHSSGRHLLSLINDILDLSKIEAGRMELELAGFSLPLALENALILVRERASRHGVTLDLAVDPSLGDFVGDERKVKQILLNLLSNAVKFTPEGGRVGLRARAVDGAVEISVSDTGIGIAPEDQEAIFEEFRQVGGDYTRKREGTGLGLALTRKFVEMHEGRIWVESEAGKGSIFTFTLPMRPWPAS